MFGSINTSCLVARVQSRIYELPIWQFRNSWDSPLGGEVGGQAWSVVDIAALLILQVFVKVHGKHVQCVICVMIFCWAAAARRSAGFADNMRFTVGHENRLNASHASRSLVQPRCLAP